MKSLIPYLCIIALLTGCSKDDDPAGPAAALDKPFNLVMTGLESTIAYSLMVSPDGTKVLAGINNEVNPEFHYSKDGGATFSPVTGMNGNLKYATELSSNGLVLTSQNRVYNMEGGTQVSISGGELVVLGDKGKVFVYHHNTATLSQKSITETAFQPITKPVVANPGSAASYYAIKVPGKGVGFVVSPINRSDKTVSVHILDEANMTWTSHNAEITWANINTCNNLMQSEKFVFASSSVMIMKGCSGMALIDIAKGETKYVKYPASPTTPNSDLDGTIAIDNSGNMFIAAASATEPIRRIFQYKSDKWEVAFNNLESSSLMAMDNNGILYFNSGAGEGTVMKSPVKVNIQSGAKTLLPLPRMKEQVFDAIALENEVILVTSSRLFRYDIASTSLTKFDLNSISHFNILSDGRWVAGGADEIYLSSDEGKTWAKTDKLFSPSLTPFQQGLVVTDTRIVNGQLLILGTSTYTYQNLSIGVTQVKHDNMLVALGGGKLNYQFPADFSDGIIAQDGTLYGSAMFVSDFGNSLDFYEIQPATPPRQLTIKQGPPPHVITDDGLQMTLGNAGSGFQVVTRKTVDEEWTPVGSPLPNTTSSFSGLKLRAGGGGLTFINISEVYSAGN